jgi:hypothetical protein
VIALAADSNLKASKLKEFINIQTGELNSALIRLVADAGDLVDDLGRIVYIRPEWSAFVQYLAHTYRQMGQPQAFADQIEQVLRSTFGFSKLRAANASQATRLLNSIRSYADYLSKPNQPLKLVDSTGFSLQSIKSVMKAAGEQGIGKEVWNAETLFDKKNDTLKKMMGILLKVPELRANLVEVTGTEGPNGDKLALILKDWVKGDPISEIAKQHFSKEGRDGKDALTICGQNLFGKLTQTTAWGLGALLSITGENIPEEERQVLNNLASKVYYGVPDQDAIALRLLGIPRMAAGPLASQMKNMRSRSLVEVRDALRKADLVFWTKSLGVEKGKVYQKVWQVLEGLN